MATAEQLAVGMRVSHKAGNGTVRFIGTVHFVDDTWVGVELDEPVGKNDGTVKGVQYFACAPEHGLLVRPAFLTVLVEADDAAPPMAPSDAIPFDDVKVVCARQLSEMHGQLSGFQSALGRLCDSTFADLDDSVTTAKPTVMSPVLTGTYRAGEAIAKMASSVAARLHVLMHLLHQPSCENPIESATIASMLAQPSPVANMAASAVAAFSDLLLRTLPAAERELLVKDDMTHVEMSTLTRRLLQTEESLTAVREQLQALNSQLTVEIMGKSNKATEETNVSAGAAAAAAAEAWQLDLEAQLNEACKKVAVAAAREYDLAQQLATVITGTAEQQLAFEKKLEDFHAAAAVEKRALEHQLATAREETTVRWHALERQLKEAKVNQAELETQRRSLEVTLLEMEQKLVTQRQEFEQQLRSAIDAAAASMEAEVTVHARELKDLATSNSSAYKEAFQNAERMAVEAATTASAKLTALENLHEGVALNLQTLVLELERAVQEVVPLVGSAQECSSQETSTGPLNNVRVLVHRQNAAIARADLLNRELDATREELMQANLTTEALASSEADAAAAQRRILALEINLASVTSDLATANASAAEMSDHIAAMANHISKLQEAYDVAVSCLVQAGLPVPVATLSSTTPSRSFQPVELFSATIPSVVLVADAGRNYFAYHISISAGPDTWMVQRRFSDFLALHKKLKRQFPALKDSLLPPKRTLGNLKAQVAESRRLALQVYLQHLFDVVKTTFPDALKSKDRLILAFPFFSEDVIDMDNIHVLVGGGDGDGDDED